MRRAGIALALAALVGVAASSGASDRGTLRVVVRRGPVTPVCAVGVPCDGPAAGVSVVVRRRSLLVARAVTGANGRALFVLAAGRYVVAVSYRGGIAASTKRGSARVTAGGTATVRFSFDTGIR